VFDTLRILLPTPLGWLFVLPAWALGIGALGMLGRQWRGLAEEDAALAGLERWKSRHAEAATHLAVDDVLVDSARGRSSTWTRIRVNLRHVPEELRPPQETPDPDEDPTREWREGMKREAAARKKTKKDA